MINLPNAALVGLGFMGRTHLQSLRRLGVKVAGILGITPEEGYRFGSELQINRIYRDYDEILSDPTVQVVHLCTPNALHYPMAKAALLAGKHVICEKPLANTSRESGELAALASEKDLAGIVNYNLRFYPLCQEARSRILSGNLGEVHLALGGYLQDWLFLPTDWNWRLDPEAGGEMRVVADIGTHWFDLVTWMTGLRLVEVMADIATVIPTRFRPLREVATFDSKITTSSNSEPVSIHTEDIATLLLRFENGARGSLTLSQVSAGRKNHFWWEVAGSKASFGWDQENPNALWIGYREKPNELVLKDPALMHPEVRSFASFPGGHAEGYPDTFYQLFRCVYTSLAGGERPDPGTIPTFEDGHNELLLCEAIATSARERRWVDVPKSPRR
jgi:predicted dehydrogenase